MKFKQGIKCKITLITLIVTFNPVACQDSRNTTTENPTDINSTAPDSAEDIYDYDYIVKLLFYVNEEKIPEYIVELIYSNSTENNITVEDILSLYGISNISLSQTQNILQELNIQTSNVLSMDGLDNFMRELNIQFRDFYNNVLLIRLNVSGLPLKRFLISLGIDSSEFTDGMAYGEPDPYEEFKKGNFSQTSLENALKIINKTANELFVACRNEIYGRAVSLEAKEAVEILKRYNFQSKKAIELWTYSNITINHLQNIPVFNNSLNALKNEQTEKTFLGILINSTYIATNKIVYEIWQQESFSKMYAQIVTSTDRREIEELSSFITNDIISLNLNGTLNTSFSILETSLDGMEDCIFVTLLNDTLLLEAVDETEDKKEYIDVRTQINRTDIVLGSPLICGGKVYGLAAQLVDTNHVRFDSFYKEPIKSSAFGLVLSEYLLVMSVLVFLSR